MAEIVFASLIVIVLVALAVYYGWKEFQTLFHLRALDPLPLDERRYRIARAWRRLVNSCLMVILAALLGGSYFLGFEQHAAEAARKADEAERAASSAPSREQQEFLNRYSALWAMIALVFF